MSDYENEWCQKAYGIERDMMTVNINYDMSKSANRNTAKIPDIKVEIQYEIFDEL